MPSIEYLPGGANWCTPQGWENVFRRTLWDDTTGQAPSAEAAALLNLVRRAYVEDEVYPAPENVFRALQLTRPEGVRVVILGQDPYHEPGQAHGLSFSVPDGTLMPPSLRNIFKEMYADLGINEGTPYPSTDLTPWAGQGVLLLNSVLTVPKGRAAGHRGLGWEAFTDGILRELDAMPQPMVFVLWGKDAQSKRALLENPAHHVLQSAHPSPLSAYRGFFGSRPFSAINAYLREHGEREIVWIS